MNAPLHDYNSARCKLSNQCILFHPCWKVLVVILALAALTLPFSNTWIDFHLISHLVLSYIHSHDLSVLDQHCQRHNGSMDGLTLALRSRLLQTLTSTIHAVFTPLSLFFAFSSFRWISCLAGVDDVDVQEHDGDAEKMSSFLKIASSLYSELQPDTSFSLGSRVCTPLCMENSSLFLRRNVDKVCLLWPLNLFWIFHEF